MADSDPKEQAEKTTVEGSRERCHEGNAVSVPTEAHLLSGTTSDVNKKTNQTGAARQGDDPNAKLTFRWVKKLSG